jgi:import inner membrane translocase subunit TIM22
MMNFNNPLGPKPVLPPEGSIEGPKERIPFLMYDEEMDKIALYLIGNHQRFRENIIIPRALGGGYIKSNEEKTIEGFMESCAFKSIMSCVIGV